MDETELIHRCLDGDETAWAALIERHRPHVRRILQAYVDAERARDLEQDVWEKLLLGDRAALRGMVAKGLVSLRAFVCRVALNHARDDARKRKARPWLTTAATEVDEDMLVTPDLLAEVERAERLGLVLEAARTAAREQPERALLIFRAYFVSGFTAREIAAMGVGLEAKGVEALLLRMVRHVRARLRERGEL